MNIRSPSTHCNCPPKGPSKEHQRKQRTSILASSSLSRSESPEDSSMSVPSPRWLVTQSAMKRPCFSRMCSWKWTWSQKLRRGRCNSGIGVVVFEWQCFVDRSGPRTVAIDGSGGTDGTPRTQKPPLSPIRNPNVRRWPAGDLCPSLVLEKSTTTATGNLCEPGKTAQPHHEKGPKKHQQKTKTTTYRSSDEPKSVVNPQRSITGTFAAAMTSSAAFLCRAWDKSGVNTS